MLELILILIFIGFVCFFFFLKIIGGLLKSFLIFSLLLSISIIGIGYFAYSDLSSFLEEDKVILVDLSDSDFAFFLRGASFSGDVDSQLSSEKTIEIFDKWVNNRSSLLDEYSRVIYINASGSSLDEEISSLNETLSSPSFSRSDLESMDLESLKRLGIDLDNIDLENVDISALRNNPDSVSEFISSNSLGSSFEFDSSQLLGFLKEGKVEFYPNSLSFRLLNYVPDFVYSLVPSFSPDII